MSSNRKPSLLEQVETALNVDADTLDAKFISELPIRVHDVTSNQRFVHEALVAEVNKEIVQQTVRELKGKPWQDVYAVCIARMGKTVLPHISGRLLAQTSTTHPNAFDEEYVYQNAKRYAAAWNAEGITNDRFCVKIATTSAGVRAARRLKDEGIATLGTTLFSLPQAVAAAQAGMHAISMYFNQPAAHTDVQSWPDVADPAVEHPMAYRHYQIREYYDSLKAQGKPVPQMKTASFISVQEVMAMPELGADHITVGLPLLSDLATHTSMPPFKPGRWKQAIKDMQGVEAGDDTSEWQASKSRGPEAAERRAKVLAGGDPTTNGANAPDADVETKDYLAEGVLDQVNEADEVTRVRLAMALERFSLMEEESKRFIEGLQASLA